MCLLLVSRTEKSWRLLKVLRWFCYCFRGKGSRDVLKKSRQGVLVHDASYHIAVQLEGPEASIYSVLEILFLKSCF